MDNLTRYNNVFQSVFNVEVQELNGDFASGAIAKWDSITHLSLITELEDEFDIMLDPEDILNFKSYLQGKEIMAKYDVELNA